MQEQWFQINRDTEISDADIARELVESVKARFEISKSKQLDDVSNMGVKTAFVNHDGVPVRVLRQFDVSTGKIITRADALVIGEYKESAR